MTHRYTQYWANKPSTSHMTNKWILKGITEIWKNIDADWKTEYIQGKNQYAGGGYMTPQ